ncbi:HAD domain-containing protein, partial [Paramuribaculum intestinale]
MNRPVIFLDFDGVLNTEQCQARLAVEGMPNKDAWGPLFDQRAVENLRRIIDATDAAIVISSSWRYAHSLGSLRIMWEVRE